MQRIKHLPTGLYYRPCSHKSISVKTNCGETRTVYVKTNLSKKGKIYERATLKWLKYGFYNHVLAQKSAQEYIKSRNAISLYGWDGRNKNHDFDSDDWAIEEVWVIEEVK